MQKIFLPLNLAAVLLCPTFAYAQNEAQNPGRISTQTSMQNTETMRPVSDTLTIKTAIATAMTKNADIAAARREIDATNGALRQAGIIPNPELSTLFEDARQESRSTTIQINQAIELGGKRSARITASERSRDAARNELAIKQAEIRAQVTAYFYDALIAQERQRIALASLELARRASTAVSKQVTLGKVPPLEETKARIAESSIRVELAQASGELILSRKRLGAMWGANLSDALVLSGDFSGELSGLPQLPSMPNLLKGMEQAPLMLRAKMEVSKRLALADLERARQIPDLTLSLGSKRDQSTGPQAGRNQAIVGLSIPLALFDRNQGNLQEARSRVDKARDELSATEIRLQSELLQAHQRLSLARDETQLLQKDLLPGAQQAFDTALKGFEYGKFNFLDVLDAQRSLLQAKAQYLRSLSEVHRAASDIERLLGDSEFNLYTTTSS